MQLKMITAAIKAGDLFVEKNLLFFSYQCRETIEQLKTKLFPNELLYS